MIAWGCILFKSHFDRVYVTGGWWILHLGGQACGNGWSGMSGMVSNTANKWFDAIPFAMFQPLL
jgi:putative NADPH-quinone reductase